jgi:hypothetical protein
MLITQLATLVFGTVLVLAAFGFIAWALGGLWRNFPTSGRMALWMDAHAAPEWRLAARLRSVQVSIFWAVLGGLWVALPAFQSYLTPVRFAMISVGFSLAILFARFTGQKGLPDA